ncbi:MAG TPA: 3-dehydroquinate synthase, partial [Candidatus Dormibacteraeota bacterium]|nr:3-dehydroquinate synthase [Candidatus Dormibacteraeota bacterium]
YRIAHGAAVALGLRAAGLLALRSGRFTQREHLRVLALLSLLGMPLATSVRAEAALGAMRGDKKRRQNALRFVLPDAIGRVRYDVRVPEATVRTVLHAMEAPPGDMER